MSAVEYKQKIKDAIESFSSGELRERALNLFEVLGYNTSRSNQFADKTYLEFKDLYVNEKFSEDKAIVKDWSYVDILFQVSKDEVTDERGLFDTGKVNDTIIESYLFFTIALKGESYSRTQLSNISREVNKLFPMPVMILFKYNGQVTVSIINRCINKKDGSKDVLEKVTLIKDINISAPHRAHVEILYDLSFAELQKNYKVGNFVELHNAWQKTLDTKELNKRFYQELSNWYFWAMDYAKFPDDIEKDKSIRNATNLIRLITRIIFIWFIKEKGFVPDKIFNRNEAAKLVKDLCKNNKSHYYYNAILQNLFFGTLNQNMTERKFAIETEDYVKRDHGVKNLYRYKDMFLIPEKQVLALFADVPFLNGGLFDCLDKDETETEKLSHQYIDGFSRNDKKRAILPDFLFFADEDEYDLNEIFGTKNKKYKVRGLIEILSSYKFTITENTPIEEEIALDPELLGKVFENLLASYNPETSTTARKQTGSFYTPREIVNYMVDESLIAYLDQKMKDAKCEDCEDKIRDLISYSEEEHKFDKKQTEVLICAIDNCKILDPACGSGAFPMGILHKLVHVLHKIDPKNEQWKKRQLDKLKAIDDPEIRDKAIEDTENAFEHNELDYGRKLYLIENCIYGVDIQPIAVQIAKLRFFISLIIDQKRDDKKENHGIRSLPNLETKFVAANTLIGLEKHVEVDINDEAQGLLIGNDLKSLESELKELRHRYFTAKTRKEKLACQKEDKKLREKISKSLISDGWDAASAKQLVAFDPYDQNASSPFFEAEWMFGVLDGFNIIIGNPPYDVYQGYRKDEIEIVKKLPIYEFAKGGKLNAYKLFLAKCSELASSKGFICQIFQNSFLGDLSALNIRDYYLTKHSIKFIDSFPERDDVNKRVFPGVKMSTCIMLACSEFYQNNTFKLNIYYDRNFLKKSSIIYNYQEIIKIDPMYKTILSIDDSEKIILGEIASNNRLKDYGKCYEGEINLTFHKKYLSTNHLKDYAPMIKGAAVQPFFVADNMSQGVFEWLNVKQYHKENSGAKTQHYKQDRIIMQGITGVDEKQRLKMTLLKEGSFCGNSVNYIVLDNKTVNEKYFLALFNSQLLNWYFKKFSTNSNVNGYEVDNLPIKINNQYSDAFCSLVSMLCFLKNREQKTNTELSIFFHKLINALVYELFFSEKILLKKCEILKYLTSIPEFNNDFSEDKKELLLIEVYKKLSNSNVSINIKKMLEIDFIKMIEDK